MIFLDTSIWISGFTDWSSDYRASRRLIGTLAPEMAAAATYSIAEVYSALTRIPSPRRIHPRAALDLLRVMQERAAFVLLDGTAYFETIDALSARGLSGGIVYDALLLACARKVNAERIYTWNPRHFRAAAPDLAERIVTP